MGILILQQREAPFLCLSCRTLLGCILKNQEIDDRKKVFDKGKYNVINQASLVDENPGYETKDTHLNEVKLNLDIKKAWPPLMTKYIVW